jgi:hypothetical protein
MLISAKSCWISLLAMETGGEDKLARDERLSVQNPAGSKVVSFDAASAPGRGTSSSKKSSFF